MAETAICVICGNERSISRMRFGRHKVPIGGSAGRSTSAGRTTRQGISMGGSGKTRLSHSNSASTRSTRSERVYYRTISGYACKFHGLLGRIVTRLVIVGILGFVALVYFNGKSGNGARGAHHRTQSVLDAVPDAYGPRSTGGTDQPATEGQGSTSADAEPASSVPPVGTTLIADPASEPRVEEAMKEALATGEPQRWHVHKLHGYAVPSAPDANGCRMIQVSFDETGDKSSATKLCP